MSTAQTADVGIVGLGIMGSAMSDRMIEAGRHVVGTDVDPRRCDELRARGGEVVESPEAVARAASVIVTSLPTDAALVDVLDGPTGLRAAGRPGLTVIETSTLSLTAKTSVQRRAAVHGITVLDCPLSGSAPQARAGELVAYLSGDDAAKQVASDALRDVAGTRHDVGMFGNGSRFKLVTNLLVAVHTLAAAEALLLAQRCGLDVDRVLQVVGDSAGTSRMFQLRGPLMAGGLYGEPKVRVHTFRKDLGLIATAAAAAGAPTPLLSTAAAYYEVAEDAGRGEQDAAAVYAVLRDLGHRDALSAPGAPDVRGVGSAGTSREEARNA